MLKSYYNHVHNARPNFRGGDDRGRGGAGDSEEVMIVGIMMLGMVGEGDASENGDSENNDGDENCSRKLLVRW